jgi:hypothetical protein
MGSNTWPYLTNVTMNCRLILQCFLKIKSIKICIKEEICVYKTDITGFGQKMDLDAFGVLWCTVVWTLLYIVFSQVIRLGRAHTTSVIGAQVRSYGAPSTALWIDPTSFHSSWVRTEGHSKYFLMSSSCFTSIAPNGLVTGIMCRHASSWALFIH